MSRGIPGSPVHPPLPLAMVAGDPTRGTEFPTTLTSVICGLRPPPLRIASGCASGTNAVRSACNGGRVFCRHTQGVPSEQNPHPPLGNSSLREEEEGEKELVNEVVKSISMGYVVGVGSKGDECDEEGLERLRLVLWGGVEAGEGDDDVFGAESRKPRSWHRQEPEEHNPQASSLDVVSRSCSGD